MHANTSWPNKRKSNTLFNIASGLGTLTCFSCPLSLLILSVLLCLYKCSNYGSQTVAPKITNSPFFVSDLGFSQGHSWLLIGELSAVCSYTMAVVISLFRFKT